MRHQRNIDMSELSETDIAFMPVYSNSQGRRKRFKVSRAWVVGPLYHTVPPLLHETREYLQPFPLVPNHSITVVFF